MEDMSKTAECMPCIDPVYAALQEKMNLVRENVIKALDGLTVYEAKNILRNIADWELESKAIVKS